MPNQDPEQKARDNIDKMLAAAGWSVQNKDRINWQISQGVAVREYQTSSGPADYVLFVNGNPVGVIEAKREKEGARITAHENQSREYAISKLKYLNNDPLPFVYESTGTVTRFTDYRDNKPRSRQVFGFHRPETFAMWMKSDTTLRNSFNEIPPLEKSGLRDCQFNAINNIEQSFRECRPKALIQMATGSGKTYTAITFIYRLLKFAKAQRVLFLVDTKNLGEQAEQEFMSYVPQDENRKFTELYAVQRLQSGYIPSDVQVCISTIQRVYSILKGEDLDESLEEEHPAEASWQPKQPLPVVYNGGVPIEHFDFIVVDECHRSIYNLWKQVLEYFDAFIIGLTATPDKRTFGFFNENVVSEYSHENAVADGVNVGYDVYVIESEITQKGAVLKAKTWVDTREKLTRRKRWEQLDEDKTYTGTQLDRDVVNPSQIRNIIKVFRKKLTEIFPGRDEVPKTLIFAKTDSHADDIIQIVREEFGESNAFCKKVTYKAEDDPKSVLSEFRNSYNPRIAVTVDMIATGTDVKPLECLLFMRDVKSRNYFEQMKGRGTRTLKYEDLKKVTPSVHSDKTHFVVVDAIGVTKSLKTDSRPLERKKSVPLKDLLSAVTMGARDEDLFLSLANRLSRLNQQITSPEREKFRERAGGNEISQVIRNLMDAYNPDTINLFAEKLQQDNQDKGIEKNWQQEAQEQLIQKARQNFTGDLNEYIENVRKVHEQIIDTINQDKILRAEWDKEATANAEEVIGDFRAYLEQHKDEITALSIFYDQPYRRREITYQMIKEVLEKLKTDKPALAPYRVWNAYAQVDKVNHASPKSELTALVALVRRVTGIDSTLTTYDQVVNRNFKKWIFQRHEGAGEKFNDEQMEWLRMIKDHVATSFHLDLDDLDYTPFNGHGGRMKMYRLFGENMNDVILEMNEVLVA